jgi:hypothetical protein
MLCLEYNIYIHIFAVLAAWYPHIVLGSLASSAPILYFEGIAPQVGYYSVVTKDFKVKRQLFIFILYFNLDLVLYYV